MSSATSERTPVMDLAAMLRAVEQAIKDGTWKRCPIGQDVHAYLRSLEWAHAPETTMQAYTYVLALLAVRHADWPDGLEGFCNPAGPEYLQEFLAAEWGGSSAATKRQRTSIVRSLFRWAADTHRITYDPSATLRGPKGRQRAARQAYPLEVLHQLVAAQESLFRDRRMHEAQMRRAYFWTLLASAWRWRWFFLIAGVFGAVLLYDAMHGHNIGGWHMPDLPSGRR